jgi:hypothetical protein
MIEFLVVPTGMARCGTTKFSGRAVGYNKLMAAVGCNKLSKNIKIRIYKIILPVILYGC